ncbi:phosphonate ABC transporter substrate-binding protein, partial [Methanosarcinales archaeon]
MCKSFEVLEGYLEKELDVEIKPFIATDYTGV